MDDLTTIICRGHEKTAVISDDPNRFPPSADWAKNSKIYHRSSLMQVQEDLRKTKGVTAIIYVQACATELRRKRKEMPLTNPEKQS